MSKSSTAAASLAFAVSLNAAQPAKLLIVDGQNNHQWRQTTPVLKKILEDSGNFQVDIATSPPKDADMSDFKPDFSRYAVVLSNYNGQPWPADTEAAFEKFVRNGGGFVSYHAADNSFPQWKAYQQMIAVGGWENRMAEKDGPRIRFRDGRQELDNNPGPCGHHGDRLPYQVTTRDSSNPVMKGLPMVWMHAADELYDSLCGPARDIDVLATAHSDPKNKGTGENEPTLMSIRYGKGRVFHTTMGHDVAAMQCVGFITTLLRGTEWAATGKVKTKVPADFPKPDEVSVRK